MFQVSPAIGKSLPLIQLSVSISYISRTLQQCPSKSTLPPNTNIRFPYVVAPNSRRFTAMAAHTVHEFVLVSYLLYVVNRNAFTQRMYVYYVARRITISGEEELCSAIFIVRRLEPIATPLSYLLAFSGIGHVFTAAGRSYWTIVLWKYFLFVCVCLGIWTDEIYVR